MRVWLKEKRLKKGLTQDMPEGSEYFGVRAIDEGDPLTVILKFSRFVV